VVPFDTAHTTLYSSSKVNMPLSITVSEVKHKAAYWSKIATPIVFGGIGARVRGEAVTYTTTLGDEKLYDGPIR